MWWSEFPFASDPPVCKPAPRLTHPTNRSLQATLSLGDGQQLVGTGAFPTALGPLPLVYAADVAGIANITDASLCAPNSLDPRKINGSVIVVGPKILSVLP